MQDSKNRHPTTLSRCVIATKARIDNRKKFVKQQYLIHMSLQYGELWLTSGWDRFVSLWHPCKFQRVSRLGSVAARHSSIGRQSNFAALNRGRHLYSAGRPSRWALGHISSYYLNVFTSMENITTLRCKCKGGCGSCRSPLSAVSRYSTPDTVVEIGP